MAVSRLPETLTAWRIGDPEGRYPIYSGDGAALNEGRWHRKGQDVIYASEHSGTAMLEQLVHFNGILPPMQHFIRIRIPAGTSYEIVTKDSLPNWDAEDAAVARDFGAIWFAERRTAILMVPSVVAREERNVLVNPHHNGAARIRAGKPEPVRWDNRLFGV